MAYPRIPPVRRSRRRRWLLAGLIGAAMIVALIFTVQYRTEARVVADYLAVTESAVKLQAMAAADLESTFAALSGVERPELLRRLQQMHEATAQAATAIDGVAVPSSAAEAHGYLTVATRSWERALGMLDEAVLAVVDDSEPPGGEGLADALILLRVGDVAYAEFLARVGDFDNGIAEGHFVAVAFVPEGGPVRFDPVTVQTRLASILHLGSQRNISITAVTDPEPFGELNNVPIVPDSENFVVQTVVANEGNETEELVSVRLNLVTADGSEPTVSVTQTIATLEPGEARTFIFDGLVLRGGALYELVIVAVTAEDDSPDDNAWRMVFYRNESV